MSEISMTDPDDALLALCRDVDVEPVFIMGHARSGTTILYQLLVATERFNWVSAYHVIDYDSLLWHHVNGRTAEAKRALEARFASLGIPAARFDGVGIAADSPEEYGFALTDGHVLRLAPRTADRFDELCRKVQRLGVGGRPLLLKNPWDYASFPWIKARWPRARFVFLHRNPAHVVGSMLAGLDTLLAERNAYHALVARFYDRLWQRPRALALVRLALSPRLGLGRQLVGWHVRRTARAFVRHVGELPAADRVSVRYEDVCRDPAREVARILDALGLEPNPHPCYRDLVRPPRTPRPTSEDERSILRKLRLRPYLAYCGYDVLPGEPT
jgi:hypothetical protein